MIDNTVLRHIDHLFFTAGSCAVKAVPRLELNFSLIVSYGTSKDRKGHPDTVFPADETNACYRIHFTFINRDPTAAADQNILIDSSRSER